MKPITSKLFWQTFIWSSILLSVFAIYQTSQQILDMGISLWHSKWIILLGLFALNIVGGAFGLRQLSLDGSENWIEKLEFSSKNAAVKLFGLILFILGFSFVWATRLIFFGDTLSQVTPIFWVFLWASLLQCLA
jgi:hypothetical protein